MSPLEAEKFLDQHVDQLLEHFDSIRIFATVKEDGGECTIGVNRGGGNFYAQFGQAREWVLVQDEYTKEKARFEQRTTLEDED